MGGSAKGLQGILGGIQPPQFQQKQFDNNQILQYARDNKTYDDGQAYKAEVVKQLRDGSYEDPYKVWGNLMNARGGIAFENEQKNNLTSLFGSNE